MELSIFDIFCTIVLGVWFVIFTALKARKAKCGKWTIFVPTIIFVWCVNILSCLLFLSCDNSYWEMFCHFPLAVAFLGAEFFHKLFLGLVLLGFFGIILMGLLQLICPHVLKRDGKC